MRKVIILRGIPGSGKSTYAKMHFPHAFTCSADNFFMQNGAYHFEPKKLNQAHTRCQKEFRNALQNMKPLIVVDNTNIHHWEMEPYIRWARLHKYEIQFIRFEISVDLATGRNSHGVPANIIQRMHDKMEPAKQEWNEIVVQQ